MGRRQDIEAHIAHYQEQLAKLNRMPEDRFNIGTMMVFSAQGGTKWYIRKVAEEAWTKLNSSHQNDLAGWIFEAEETGSYFEVYEMRTQPQPIYAKDV